MRTIEVKFENRISCQSGQYDSAIPKWLCIFDYGKSCLWNGDIAMVSKDLGGFANCSVKEVI